MSRAENSQPLLTNGQEGLVVMEPRPYRPFKSSEEYLIAMREDLAEWLQRLYPQLDVTSDNFMQILDDGVALCQHANNVRKSAASFLEKLLERGGSSGGLGLPPALLERDVPYRSCIKAGSFFARDNVHNFIQWCRMLGVYECLLFETDDLVLRKNEKSFILCLLEVARRGSRFGMPVPLLVQFEKEIDRELASEGLAIPQDPVMEDFQEFCSFEGETKDRKSLDEMVRDLVEECGCPAQFPMIRISEGKYRIGDTKMLIFVRILRNHVMVRVGGGWDTLSHYLEKHDPCRCRSGHRAPISSKLSVCHQGLGDTQMEVTYERSAQSPQPVRKMAPPPPLRKYSTAVGFMEQQSSSGRNFRQRSQSPSVRFGTVNRRSVSPSYNCGLKISGPGRGESQYENELNLLPQPLNDKQQLDVTCSSDSSSEISDEGYRSTAAPTNTSFSDDYKTDDSFDRPESSCTQVSSSESGVSVENGANSIAATSAAAAAAAKKSKLPMLQGLRSLRVSFKHGEEDERAIPPQQQQQLRVPRSSSSSRTSSAEQGTMSRSNHMRHSLRIPRSRTNVNFSQTDLNAKPASGTLPATGNAWIGRRREKTFVSGDTYQAPPTSGRQPRPFSQIPISCRAASASPSMRRKQLDPRGAESLRATGMVAASSVRSLKPPKSTQKISPILQDILTDVDIDDDELILRKMEQIVNQYKSKSLEHGRRNSCDLLASTTNRSRMNPSPRASTSKIPMPVFYRPRESFT